MTEEEKEKLLRFSLLYFRRGEIRKALLSCQQVLEADPNNPTALELLGDIKAGQGELQDALDLYKKAKENNPSSDEVEKKIARTVLRIAEEEGKFDLKLEPIKKLPLISGFLSLVFAGLGQFYNGDISKGVVGIILSLIFLITFAFVKRPEFLLAWFLLNIGFALEAYYKAKKISSPKDGESGKQAVS